jgi:hypothetical protein
MSSIVESTRERHALSGFHEFTKPVVELTRSLPCRMVSGACTDGRLEPTVRLELRGHPTDASVFVSTLLPDKDRHVQTSADALLPSHVVTTRRGFLQVQESCAPRKELLPDVPAHWETA